MTAIQRRESALLEALLELERYVNSSGWDQPFRLFALADAADLRRREPNLQLTEPQRGDELVAIEQELPGTAADAAQVLAQVSWPAAVVGAALVIERLMVPAAAEQVALDSEPDDDVVSALAEHPERSEVRIAVAVTRTGQQLCALRFRDHDSDEQVLTGTDLVDSVAAALLATFD